MATTDAVGINVLMISKFDYSSINIKQVIDPNVIWFLLNTGHRKHTVINGIKISPILTSE